MSSDGLRCPRHAFRDAPGLAATASDRQWKHPLNALGTGTRLDATPVPLFSRGPSKRTGLCASDADGGWYVREGDHREREDDKGKPLRKLAWALEATIAATAAPPAAPPATPSLATGMAMTRPGQDPGGTGARVLASVAARSHQTGWLGYDRTYTQDSRTASTCRSARSATGPSWTTGTTSSASRPTPRARCWWRAAGTAPRCPNRSSPATTGLRGHTIDRETYAARVAARVPYQMKRKDGPDADGYERRCCPATGIRPGLMCPLRPPSLSPRDGRTKVLQPPQEPPKLCRQTAITIAPDVGARYRQDLPYGSPAWHTCYATLRNTIEGLNGYAKDPAHQALAQPARRRVRGIAAQTLFTAPLLPAAARHNGGDGRCGWHVRYGEGRDAGADLVRVRVA